MANNMMKDNPVAVATPVPEENEADGSTRSRLLQAAMVTFAERGYHHATIRDICQRAGTNVAAVHYHFGDKDRLYIEVLREAERFALTSFPLDAGLPPTEPAADRLRGFVRAILSRLLDTSPSAVKARLMTRELMDPTPMLDVIVEEIARPNGSILIGLCAELLGPDIPINVAGRHAASVVAQAFFYHSHKPIIEKMGGPMDVSPAAIDSLTDHITRVSLAAIAAERQRLANDATHH